MSATLESRTALWLLGLFSVGVYVFQFAPIAVVMLLSFNASRSGAFPMEGVSLQWYGKLFQNDSILEAFQTSIVLALGCSPWQTFREVTLPLSLPGLGAGCMLCFVLAAGSYVTPRLLGGPDTLFFPDLIYEAIISQLDWPTGSVLSVILLLSLGLLVAVYNRFMSLSDIYRSFAR